MLEVKDILELYTDEIHRIFGKHLEKVLLYGSYARGEETPSSDIDIMILVDLSDQEIKKYSDELYDITYDLNLDHDVLLMPIIKNEEHFNHWAPDYPFYTNVQREGVELYGAA